jgi:hypothetical protein
MEVERPVRRGSRPFAPTKGPELVEGLDPKPLKVRPADLKRVEVNSLHLSVEWSWLTVLKIIKGLLKSGWNS